MHTASLLSMTACLAATTGCTLSHGTAAFTLSDESALGHAAGTAYVSALKDKHPNTILHVEDRSLSDRYIYLGFDEGTHTTRHATLRVDAEGTVYRNGDPAGLDEVWLVIAQGHRVAPDAANHPPPTAAPPTLPPPWNPP